MSTSKNSEIVGMDEGIFHLTLEQQEDILSSLSTREKSTSSFIFSKLATKIKQFYDEEGYVLIRGLIDPEMIRQLQRAGDMVVRKEKNDLPSFTFTSVQFGAVFSGCEEKNDDDDVLKIFREVALRSAVPAFISRVLLRMDEEVEEKDGDTMPTTTTDYDSTATSKTIESNSTIQNKNLRVVSDVFLAKTGKEESACGWHVDALSFWPCSAHQDSSIPVGVNAWIALDDIPSKTHGGGMAIVPRSHSKDCEWQQKGYDAIGSTKNHPLEGYNSITEMISKTPPNPCDLENISPELNDKLEKMGKAFNYQQGDVLLMSRWLWHRSMQLLSDEENETEKLCLSANSEKEKQTFKRYTIRYECGNTRLPNGASLHHSILYDPSNAGKTLNQICTSTGLPFFPQAWPCVSESELFHMKKLVKEVLPKTELKRQKLMAEIFASITDAKEPK